MDLKLPPIDPTLENSIASQYKLLTEMVEDLCRSIRSDDATLPAQCYTLPFPDYDTIPDQLESTAVTDPTLARVEAVNIYRQLEIQKTQKAYMCVRVAGAIASSQKTIDIANAVNQEKTKLKELIQQLAETSVIRTPMAHKVLPRVMLLQAYRHIPIFSDQANRVSLVWASTSAIKKIEKEKILKSLANEKLDPPKGVDAATWGECIDKESQKVSSLTRDNEFAIKKPIQPHPRANIAFHNASGELMNKMIGAHTPILYLHSKKVPIISGLSSYDIKNARNTRKGKEIDGTPIVKRINLYRYKTNIAKEA